MDPRPATVDNPYKVALGKKTRSLTKKLQRIARTEDLRAAGKPINGEQLKLLESKSAVEVALAEHDRFRSAIEEVDRELEGKAIAEAMDAPPASVMSSASSDSQTDVMFTPASSDEADNESGSVDAPKELPEQAKMDPADVTAQDGPAKPPDMGSTGIIANEETPVKLPRVESLGVATDPYPTEHASVQTDLSGPPPPPGLDPAKVANEAATAALVAAQDKDKSVGEAEARGLAAGRAEMTSGLTKIFSFLHAAARGESKGETLPSAVDIFSKILVGKTSPPYEADFDRCVDYSVERAQLFVGPAYSSHEIVPGTSIQVLQDYVSSIREEIVNGPAAPAEPVFNFFPDSCPARPSEDGSVAASGTSSPPPPPKVAEPLHNKEQHAMALLLPRPQVSPQHPVKTISPSSPSPRHATGQDAGNQTQESGFLGRQASEMEEGVLPPVVEQEHLRPPPTAVLNGVAALPKRERRQRIRFRGPPPPPPFFPPFSPGSLGGGGARLISQRPNLSPTMLRQQQMRPPLMYQHLSPRCTPLQAGQRFISQALSPSPPAPGTPQSLPPEGSTNGGYAHGWGYQPHAPQEALFAQNQWYQHKPYGRPMHPAPMYVHSGPVDGAPWGRGGVTPSPPNEYSPGVSPSFSAADGPPQCTKNEMPQDFSNGLAVTSDQADTDHDPPAVVETETEPPPIPTDSGSLGQPSGFTPAVERTPPSVQPPPGAPPTSSLAQEVASSPQGQPREAEVGPRPATIDATRDSVASERGRGLVDEDHHPPEQHALSNGVVPSLAEVIPTPETSGAPAPIAKSTVSDTLMTCTDGKVSADSAEASGEGAAGKPRPVGKGRGSHSRARATRRGESRVTASKDRKNGDVPPQPKPVTKDGRGQRRSRDQRRGQPLQRKEEIRTPITAHDQAAHTPPQPPEGRSASRYQHESAKSMASTPLALPPTVTLQPKISSRTPVSLSWADEIPSPRAQPAQQQRRRGNGGGWNRQTSQQTSPTSDIAQQKHLNGDISQRKTPINHPMQQKPPGSKNQGHEHDGNHRVGPSHDVETSHPGRKTRRYRQGPSYGASGSVANNQPREPTCASVNGHNGGKYPEKQGQPRANGGLNNRSLGVASQGPGNRKGRASSHRRKGGGNGSNENGNGGGGVQHSL